MLRVIEDYAERISGAESISALHASCSEVLADLGIPTFALAHWWPPIAEHELVYMGTYPPAWLDRYKNQVYERCDPVIQLTAKAVGPFEWSSEGLRHQFGANSQVRQLMGEAMDFGIRSAVSMPLPSPDQGMGGIHMVIEPDGGAALERFADIRVPVTVIASLASERLLNLIDRRRVVPDLSARQRECLSWAARGKSNWEISQILGISEDTARQHMKSAMRKLDAGSRTLAVVKAMTFGLVDL